VAKAFDHIGNDHARFIRNQPIFFVATAAANGHINLSPKGYDTLRVVGPNRVCWLNLTGSGNETAAHLLADGRITLMLCAFSGDPMILRLYGTARTVHPRDAEWEALIALFPDTPGYRQVIDMQVERVQSSCGFSVPEMEFTGERTRLKEWAQGRGPEGLVKYWREKNAVSMDGLPTGIDPALD